MSRIILGISDVAPTGDIRDKLEKYIEYLEDEKESIWRRRMKLKNKKTGKVIEWFNNTEGIFPNSLAELNEEWEDYTEEQKEYYWIDYDGEVKTFVTSYEWQEKMKELGNYFETKEEAEKAVEKLKAWKRLKDKGFRFSCHTRRCSWANLPEVRALEDLLDITAYLPSKIYHDVEKDLDLLFGGEK